MNENIFGLQGRIIINNSKTGKILVDTHNIITNSGREYILGRFLGTSSNTTNGNYTYNEEISNKINVANTNYKLGKVIFSNTNEEPKLDDTLIPSGTACCEVALKKDNITVTKDTISEHYVICIKLTGIALSSIETAASINKLSTALIATIPTNSTANILFSEAKFDDIPVSNDTSVDMNYYIYF